MKQRGAQRLGIQPHAGADLGYANRVDDEVLAGPAALVGVVDARVNKGVLEAVAVDRYGRMSEMLLDDREQVGQQPLLGGRQLSMDDRFMGAAPLGLIDPRPRSRNQRRGSALGAVASAPDIGGLLGPRAA
jgi:hypothetical protein